MAAPETKQTSETEPASEAVQTEPASEAVQTERASEAMPAEPESLAVPVEPYEVDAGWQYRAEGGANIVISVPYQGRVLRFPKTLHADPVARLRRLADYRNGVIAPLLGESGGAPWQVVRLVADDLRRLAATIEPLRPLRRRVDAINSGGFALKMEDCAVFPVLRQLAPRSHNVFSVEIKAKQGFLDADDDLGVCSFCMKQYLKLKRGSVQRVSGYCPLDLFSGEFPRVDRALRALLDDPQNNLRVFMNGEFLYGARAGADRAHLLEAVAAAVPDGAAFSPDRLLQLWTHLMFTVLCTSDAACQPTPDEAAPRRPAGRCVPGAGPPPHSFLGTVLGGQRLAAAGPRHTAQLHDQLTAAEPGRTAVRDAFAAPFRSPLWSRVLTPAAAEDEADPVVALQRYSIGATMRDCSLMITMRRVAPTDAAADYRIVTDLAGNLWLCLCRVMDLDPKHIQRVTRQRLKKEKSRELYLRAQAPPEPTVPIPCNVSDEGIDHLLAVSGSPV